MANRWGKKWKQWQSLFSWATKSLQMVTTAIIKRRLLLGRKAMTNLDSVFKSRDITLPTKVHIVKAVVFAVVMYGCESWIIKKAEHRIIDAFELWCWKRLLRVPWTARRSNQSILKEISPEYALEGLMLKLQYFGLLMKSWTPMQGKIEGKRRRGQQRVRWFDGITHSMDMNLSKFWEIVKDRETWPVQFMGSQRVRHDLVTEQQQMIQYTGSSWGLTNQSWTFLELCFAYS